MTRTGGRLGGASASRYRRLWLTIMLLLALAWTVDLVRVWRITNWHDLDVFLRAAHRVVAGENIYADAAPFQAAIEAGTFSMKDDSVVWPYAYAPLIAVALVPATWVSYPVVRAVWWGMNVLLLLVGSGLVLRIGGSWSYAAGALTFLLLYRYDPAVVALRLGQIEIVQFALLAFSAYMLVRRRDRWGGAALGLATGIKFFPGALIGLLVWQRRWRAAAWAVAVATVGIVAPALVTHFSMTDYLDYASMYGIGGAFAGFPLNQSFNGFFSRNLIENVFTATLRGMHLPGLARGLMLLCSAVVVGVSAWLTWRRGQRREWDDRRFALEYALGVTALLLISPHSQVYTFVWALIPLLGLLTRILMRPAPAWWQWVGLIVSSLLIGRRWVLFVPGLTRLVQAHYMFGALLLWVTLALTLWWEPRRPAGPFAAEAV